MIVNKTGPEVAGDRTRPHKAVFFGKFAIFAYSQRLVHSCVCLSVCLCVKIVHTGHTLAKIKNVKNDVCRF